MTRTQIVYTLSHRWMRKRLNAGCALPERAPVNAGPEWSAARAVVAASGRQPAPVYNHALHYDMTYVLRAKANGSAT